jgi:hypothetical protein
LKEEEAEKAGVRVVGMGHIVACDLREVAEEEERKYNGQAL